MKARDTVIDNVLKSKTIEWSETVSKIDAEVVSNTVFMDMRHL